MMTSNCQNIQQIKFSTCADNLSSRISSPKLLFYRNNEKIESETPAINIICFPTCPEWWDHPKQGHPLLWPTLQIEIVVCTVVKTKNFKGLHCHIYISESSGSPSHPIEQPQPGVPAHLLLPTPDIQNCIAFFTITVIVIINAKSCSLPHHHMVIANIKIPYQVVLGPQQQQS